MEELNQQAPHILLVPYPAQGHMPALLDLAHRLYIRKLYLTIVITPSNVPLLTPLLSKCPSIQTLSLPFPSNPVIPTGIENAKDLHPGSFTTLIHTLTGLYDPVLAWIQSQSHHPVTVIIADFFHGWTQNLARKLGIPRIVFAPSGVHATAVLHSLFRRMPQRPDPITDEDVLSFPAIPNSPSFKWRQISMLYRTYVEGNPISESVKQNFQLNLNSWGIISNTFKALEAVYLDSPLEDLGFRRVWAVGPLALTDDQIQDCGVPNAISSADVTSWLDKRKEVSVLYICFGSQALVTPEQAASIAGALEKTGVQFIWAVPQSTAIPEGFAERTSNKGMVIKGWAPQVAILRHAAVGWFLTHCGWNSVLESVAAGVSMLTWPMTADQFANARLMVDEAGVALSAWEGYTAADEGLLANVVAEAMGERGKAIRERSKEMRGMAAEAVREGGSSCRDLDELVCELWNVKKGVCGNACPEGV